MDLDTQKRYFLEICLDIVRILKGKMCGKKTFYSGSPYSDTVDRFRSRRCRRRVQSTFEKRSTGPPQHCIAPEEAGEEKGVQVHLGGFI